MKCLALIALLLAVPPLFASPAPPTTAFSAEYSVTTTGRGHFPIGSVHWSLAGSVNGEYVFKQDVTAGGLFSAFIDPIAQRTRWVWHDGVIRPLQYDYERTGKKPKHVTVAFDWGHNVARISGTGDNATIPLQPVTYDELVYQLAIMYDLQASKSTLTYPMVDTHKFKTYQFRVTGHETITTPLGTFKTVKVQRVAEADGKTTILWCAPGLGYLPVRIEQHEKNDFTATLRSVEGLGARQQ